MTDSPGFKFVMWVDSVGGYFVTTADRVVVGQPVPNGPADIGLLADLSRRHAEIHRNGEGYTLTPTRDCSVNKRPINTPAPLVNGDLLGFGDSAEMRFTQPHPLSSTARLEPLSRHRMTPAVDAVILMAQTCVLGPKPTSHIVCRNWSDEMALFRDGQRLSCGSQQGLEIDGVRHKIHGPLGMNSRIIGPDFAVSIEEV